jgi:hypothetical protein
MKKLLFASLLIAVIFTACEKEEETIINNTTPISYMFSCKVDGAAFADNSPIATINPATNVFTLDAIDGNNTIRIIIYNFSDRTEGEEISLNNLTDKAYVTKDGVDYTNTQSGKVTFSQIDSKLSGTFNFTSKSADFSTKTVTEGSFIDISY